MEKYDKFSEIIKIKHSNNPSWIDGRYMLFANDVVAAVGLQRLVNFVKIQKNNMAQTFPISLTFLRNYLFFSYRMRQKKDPAFSAIKYCSPNSPTDVLVALVMQYRLKRSPTIRSYVQGSSLESRENSEIQVSYNDPFKHLLIKCAVIHLTHFHQKLRENEYCKEMNFANIVNHYKALYWFKEKRYDIVEKLCSEMFSQQTQASIFPPGLHFIQHTFSPTCFRPFHHLFAPEVLCVTGLMFIINERFLVDMRHEGANWGSEHLHCKNSTTLEHMSTEFIPQYLFYFCMIERCKSVEETRNVLRHIIVSAFFHLHLVSHIREMLFLEQALLVLIVSKLHVKYSLFCKKERRSVSKKFNHVKKKNK